MSTKNQRKGGKGTATSPTPAAASDSDVGKAPFARSSSYSAKMAAKLDRRRAVKKAKK